MTRVISRYCPAWTPEDSSRGLIWNDCIRRLSVADRPPQLGDVLFHGRRFVTIRGPLCFGSYLVLDTRGLTRLGEGILRGWRCQTTWTCGTKEFVYVGAYWYASRADGGQIDYPLDAGPFMAG